MERSLWVTAIWEFANKTILASTSYASEMNRALDATSNRHKIARTIRRLKDDMKPLVAYCLKYQNVPTVINICRLRRRELNIVDYNLLEAVFPVGYFPLVIAIFPKPLASFA